MRNVSANPFSLNFVPKNQKYQRAEAINRVIHVQNMTVKIVSRTRVMVVAGISTMRFVMHQIELTAFFLSQITNSMGSETVGQNRVRINGCFSVKRI
jgi:hypothetical protein